MIERIYISLILLLSVSSPVIAQTNGQNDNLLNIQADTLIINVLSTNNFDKQTEIDEIKDLYKLSIWHFAPGISYDFINNRYYLTVSTSGLVNHFVSKKQEKRRISAIERKYKAKETADELKVANKLLSIQADYQDLILSKKSVQIEIDIFMILKEQHEKNEIDMEKYLNAKKNIINTIKIHNSAVTELYKEILQLSSICNSPISADLSGLYFKLDFLAE
jgi:hypothetical protein